MMLHYIKTKKQTDSIKILETVSQAVMIKVFNCKTMIKKINFHHILYTVNGTVVLKMIITRVKNTIQLYKAKVYF